MPPRARSSILVEPWSLVAGSRSTARSGWWPPAWLQPSSSPSTWTAISSASWSSTCRRAPGWRRAPLEDGGALQIATLLNVGPELRKLGLLLGAVAFVGVVLAVALGWLVARTALVPLNSLTGTVEDLAETTDVSRRLSPGGPDELGRLRRAFNRLLEALDTSRRAQSQLVLDASHELRTPLTSLRTNLEVIRRVDELSVEDRSVLVDDVLVQLQELTDLVGDLAELARGDQHPSAARAHTPRPAGGRGGPGPDHPRPGRGGHLRAQGRRVLDRRARRPPVEGGGQPARQRPQVEPDGPSRSPCTAPMARWWCTTGAPASPPRTCPRSSIASTARRPPADSPAQGSGLAIVAQVVKADGGTVSGRERPGWRRPPGAALSHHRGARRISRRPLSRSAQSNTSPALFVLDQSTYCCSPAPDGRGRDLRSRRQLDLGLRWSRPVRWRRRRVARVTCV